MALSHFHYLVTAFSLTVWTRAPFLVLALFWTFQAILFITGIAVPDLQDFVFWQFLTTVAGVLVGVTFFLVASSPKMLQFRSPYAGVWAKFVVWLIFYIAGQLFFGFFRPPASPWGLIGTFVTHIIVMVGIWLSLLYSSVIFRNYLGKNYLFMTWIVCLGVMELLFFLTYAITLERWTAYISAVTIIIGLLILRLVYPLKPAYTNPSDVTTSATPLIVSKNENI